MIWNLDLKYFRVIARAVSASLWTTSTNWSIASSETVSSTAIPVDRSLLAQVWRCPLDAASCSLLNARVRPLWVIEPFDKAMETEPEEEKVDSRPKLWTLIVSLLHVCFSAVRTLDSCRRENREELEIVEIWEMEDDIVTQVWSKCFLIHIYHLVIASKNIKNSSCLFVWVRCQARGYGYRQLRSKTTSDLTKWTALNVCSNSYQGNWTAQGIEQRNYPNQTQKCKCLRVRKVLQNLAWLPRNPNPNLVKEVTESGC